MSLHLNPVTRDRSKRMAWGEGGQKPPIEPLLKAPQKHFEPLQIPPTVTLDTHPKTLVGL